MSYTKEYDVQGRVVIEGKDEQDCDEELDRQLSEVFFTYETRGVK